MEIRLLLFSVFTPLNRLLNTTISCSKNIFSTPNHSLLTKYNELLGTCNFVSSGGKFRDNSRERVRALI